MRVTDDPWLLESSLMQDKPGPYLCSQKLALLASALNATWVKTVASALRAEALAATPNSGSTALPLTIRPAMRRRWRRGRLRCWAFRRDGAAGADGDHMAPSDHAGTHGA